MKYIDLFCGIGSFHYSFRKLGFECVMACDINSNARDTYEYNYGLSPLQSICDILPDDVKSYDILCAGFPCQAFSQCGKQKGFEDDRGNLFFHILKFLDVHHPRFVVLENVPSLKTHDKGRTFDIIMTHLSQAGYEIQYSVLKCSDYGIPQMRKRLFIIGIRKDIFSPNTDILNLSHYHKTTTLSQYLDKDFRKDTAYTIRCGGRGSHIDNRHNWDSYYLQDGTVYSLTIQDAQKLQGFDTSFKLIGSKTSQWKLLGNTIPTVFTHMIGQKIRDYT